MKEAILFGQTLMFLHLFSLFWLSGSQVGPFSIFFCKKLPYYVLGKVKIFQGKAPSLFRVKSLSKICLRNLPFKDIKGLIIWKLQMVSPCWGCKRYNPGLAAWSRRQKEYIHCTYTFCSFTKRCPQTKYVLSTDVWIL